MFYTKHFLRQVDDSKTMRSEFSPFPSTWIEWYAIKFIMRPSSLGGGRILRRTLSVRLSVRPVRPVMERHLAPPSELQWHTEGRITYGHLGRTNLLPLQRNYAFT